MRTFVFILSICAPVLIISQINQVNTGTTENLIDLSIIGNNIVISGTHTYMATSSDEAANLNLIAKPSITSFYNRIEKVDTNSIFLYSFSSSQRLIYHSNNNGNTWLNKYNSTGCINCVFSFHDTLNGYMTNGGAVYKTNNGANSFTQLSPPYQISVITVRTYSTSYVVLAGLNISSSDVVLSKNNGNSWSSQWALWNMPSDVFFLNKDTIFAISDVGGFINTFDGGNLWYNNSPYIPLKTSNKLIFKNYLEGYAVGSDNQNNGTIAKTSDLGKSWTTYNTGIKTTLFNIAFLNDSIAFLSGSNGVLLRWNYKQSIFTGEDELSIENIGVKIYPNPVSDKLKIDFVKNEISIENMCILNTLGSTVFETKELKKEIDVSFLKPGLYFLKIVSGAKQKTIKFIKV